MGAHGNFRREGGGKPKKGPLIKTKKTPTWRKKQYGDKRSKKAPNPLYGEKVAKS